MRRVDLFNTTLEVTGSDGTKQRYSIDKKSPTKIKAQDKKYRPSNGLENELSLGGPRSNENVTLTRLYDKEARTGETTTIDESLHWLFAQAGRAHVSVIQQPIDENGHNFGQSIITNGKLIEVEGPESDSNADKEALVTFVCSLETNVS